MPVLANDFRALWSDISEAAIAAVQRVGESGWFVLGEEVRGFEHDLAEFHGVEHAIGVASGLDAIEIGLRAAGIGTGDRVLTTPLTAFATTLAILRAGASPVYVDVDDQGLLDLDAVSALLKSDRSIAAIVPVHLYGQVVDMARLSEIAAAAGVIIVEDAAQAIGARDGARPVGSATIGAATSFYPTKNLGALGDGGAFLTNDGQVAAAARRLRDYGQAAKYEHVTPGLNSRLDELHAAVLRTAVLPRLGAALQRRAAVAERYLAEITNPSLRLPAPHQPSTWHLFPVFVEGRERDALQEHLQRAEVQTAVHYPILASSQRALAQPEPDDHFPRAYALATTELSLPVHPYLSDDDVQQVINACNAW